MKPQRTLIFLAVSLLLLTGCELRAPRATPIAGESNPTGALPSVPPSPTPIPSPSPTSLPLAARVNGEGILLSEYQAELERFQMAQKDLGKEVTPADARQRVFDELVGQVLLAQGAAKAGFTVTDAALQAALDKLAQQSGGADKLAAWEQKYHYTDVSFRLALKRQLAAAWQRDQVAAKAPATAEQVHARQILVYDREKADTIYQQLQDGTDFATLAKKYDPQTSGELGWFPRGTLTQTALEDAAFALQAGQYSPVVETKLGFQIVQVIERETQHPLAPDLYRAAQRKAVEDWLAQQRKAGTVELMVND